MRKGLDVLLNALASLSRRDFQLSIVGKENKVEFYKERAAQLGLQNKVCFFGPQPHIRPFYQMADALVIPSFYDPFANVTIEALAMGLFVVSSKTNGGHEILTDHNGAIIENLLDSDAIKAALERAMLHRKTRGSATRIRQSAAPFDFSFQLQKLIEAL